MMPLSLAERGIADSARTAGWKPYKLSGRAGYLYPVHYPGGTAQRWKAMDGNKPKCLWHGKKPEGCKYYVPQGVETLRFAIAAADGAIYVANGEPALLAMLAAGVQNVVCWFGEGQPPHTLAADLRQWDVQTVRYLADKEDKGATFALKVRDQLKDSGIGFYPLQWDENVPDKGDANDAWISVGFNAERFIDTLHNLNALILPAEAPERPKSNYRERATFGSLNRDQAIAAVLEKAEANGKVKTRGEWRDIHCLLHDDDEASATIHSKSGWYICRAGCGEFKLHELCERLGIDYAPYTPPALTRRVTKTAPVASLAPPADMLRYHAQGMPDTWRFGTSIAMPDTGVIYEIVTDACRTGDLNPDEPFTAADIMQAALKQGRGISANLVYKGLSEGIDTLFARFHTDQEQDSVWNLKNKSHRPKEQYRLLPLDEQQERLLAAVVPDIIQRRYPAQDTAERHAIAAPISEKMLVEHGVEDAAAVTDALQAERTALYETQVVERQQAARLTHRDYEAWAARLSDTTSTPLDWTFGAMREWRIAAIRAVKRARPDLQWLQGDSAVKRTLGLGDVRTAVKLLEAAGIERETDQKAYVTITNGRNIEQQAHRGSMQHKGRPLHYIAVQGGRTTIYPYGSQYMPEVVQALEAGARVQIEYQIANKHHVNEAAVQPKRERPVRGVQTHAVRETNAMPKPDAAAPVPQRRTAYRIEWLKAQIALSLERRGDRYLKPDTGEVIPADCDLAELIGLVIGREVKVLQSYAYPIPAAEAAQ